MTEIKLSGEQAHDAIKEREMGMNQIFSENPWLMGRLAHLHSEISEAFEYVMEGDNECFAGELADVVIYTADICKHLNIDLMANISRRLKELKEMGNPY